MVTLPPGPASGRRRGRAGSEIPGGARGGEAETGSVVKVPSSSATPLGQRTTTVAGRVLSGPSYRLARSVFPMGTSPPTRARVDRGRAAGCTGSPGSGPRDGGPRADSLSRMIGIDRAEIEARLESAHFTTGKRTLFSRGAYSHEPITGAGRAGSSRRRSRRRSSSREATRFDGRDGALAAALATGTGRAARFSDLDQESAANGADRKSPPFRPPRPR